MTSSAVVSEIAEQARRTGRLGIDTEFMGEGRYRSLLCLIQVAVQSTDDPSGPVRVEILDPLSGELEPGPLADVLADPDVEIIMHAARQDVALLRREWHTEITSLFDTQVAAGFAGMRAQLGYDALLHELVGVRLRKSASFTRWDARPLSDEQAEYAREDVLHLIEAAVALQERLEAQGRLDWAREECRVLERATDERDPLAIFARLPRVGSLAPEQRAVALELVRWRDDTARQEDRPVQQVLQDAGLVEIAKRRPADDERLRQIRGLHEGTVRRRGRGILQAVEDGRAADPIPADGIKLPPGHPGDAALIVLAEALVRARAVQAELAYELLAARADLQRIITSVRQGLPEPDVRTLQGWRRELVGDELLELLAGRRAMRIDDRLELVVDHVD